MNIPLTPIRFLRYAQQQFPQRTAAVCGEERFTYAQFAERAGKLAGALRKMGVQPGERVAFLSANCHRLLEAYYGVLEAGAVLLPLNVRLGVQELVFMLNHSGARTLFYQKRFIEIAESLLPQVSTVKALHMLDGVKEEDWETEAHYEALLADAPIHRADIMAVDENALAEMFYTSGTSAEPKGVMLTHRNVYLHALNTGLGLQTEKDAVELHTIPMFHANGWGVPHFLTLLGGKHVMIPRFEPPEVFRLIEKERVNYCSLVPAMATALVNCPERPKYDLSTLKRINIGGAMSSPTLVREVEEKLGCTCFSGYGLTETSPVLSISLQKAGLDWKGEEKFARQAMTGYSVPGAELRVVDADGEDVPRDGQSVGEIVARSDGVMQGYWKQPEASAEVLRGGWFHTGDMAVWDEQNYILIVDRQKDIIISGGENISSLELERAILSHPAVMETAVVPVPDEKWGEVPKALVVLKPDAQAGEIEIIEHCRSRLAHYKCPRTVEFFASLPKTGTGKVLKRELRKKYWHNAETIRALPAAEKSTSTASGPSAGLPGGEVKSAAQKQSLLAGKGAHEEMDLNLTPDEISFRDEFRAWLESNVPKDWNAWREKPLEESFPYLRAWQRKLQEGGWAAVSWPKQYGGRGASLMQQAIFWEEMARLEAPPMANALGLGLIGPTIIAFGSDAQKKRFIPKILSAEEIWCQGFSEPNAGSDLAALQTEARLDGDHYVVNGQKVWTSYGWVGDWCELVVRTDPAAPKHKGLTVLLVDMKSPGVEVRPLRQMTGESEFNELFFRDVRVPVENVLGKVNDGWNVAVSTLMYERGSYGARLHLIFKHNINRLFELARVTPRNGGTAAQDPLIRQKLAQLFAEIEIMRLNQLRAFSRMTATGVPGPEGSIQKIFWSELNQRLQQVAQEILGPYGQLLAGDGHAVDKGIWSYGYLRTRGNTIEAGTSEVQRNIIGHFVLGLPRSY